MTRGARLKDELEAVYRLRYRRFLRVATAILGDEASAHDAVQEGFAQALRGSRSFRREGPLGAWVWRMVVNSSLGARRAHIARRETSETGAGAAAGGQGTDDIGIRACVAALPERQRLAVYLRYYA